MRTRASWWHWKELQPTTWHLVPEWTVHKQPKAPHADDETGRQARELTGPPVHAKKRGMRCRKTCWDAGLHGHTVTMIPSRCRGPTKGGGGYSAEFHCNESARWTVGAPGKHSEGVGTEVWEGAGFSSQEESEMGAWLILTKRDSSPSLSHWLAGSEGVDRAGGG